MQRFVVIEDESQNPSKLKIPEKSMKVIQDSSHLRPDKMLTKLAKDGVIFLRASSDDDKQKVNALKLRGDIIRLLGKYEFCEEVAKDGKTFDIEQNVIKPKHESLKAVFVGSVGINEPKSRSFWTFNEKSNDAEDSMSILPESQTFMSSPTPPIKLSGDDNEQECYSELTDDDKKKVFNWANERESCKFIKERVMSVFESFAKSDTSMDWKQINIVNPIWFRIQSIASLLHSDIPYLLGHTNLLQKISGQKHLISGIDICDKAAFGGKKSKILKSKLQNKDNTNCPLCAYKFVDGDSEKEQMNENNDKPIGDNNLYHPFCPNCCDLRFGLYTVWTALDYFDCPFDTGSGTMIFGLGSHSKFKGIYEATLQNKAVPIGYSKKTSSEKANLRWGYVPNIRPGDMFIFDVKTLHGSTESTDGYMRARIDMRVSIKPSHKRYVKEMNEIKENKERSISHLGLSQLCTPPMRKKKANESPELNKPPERVLSEGENDKLSQTVDDALDLNVDDTEEQDAQRMDISDLPTQMNDDHNDNGSNINKPQTKVTKKKNRSITPIDVLEEDDLLESNRTIPETPKGVETFQPMHTPESIPSVQSSPIKQKSVHQQMANYIAPTQSIQYTQPNNAQITQQRLQQIVPSSQCQSLPRLEQQSPHNLRTTNDQFRVSMNVNQRKRTFASMDNVTLSQEKEKETDERLNISQQPPNKRQKVSPSPHSGSGNKYHFTMSDNKLRLQNVRSFNTMSDEELGRKIATMRNKMNRTMTQLTNQCSESLDLMEVANERYLYMKQQQQQERNRANHFEEKVQTLQKSMIENFSKIQSMFD